MNRWFSEGIFCSAIKGIQILRFCEHLSNCGCCGLISLPQSRCLVLCNQITGDDYRGASGKNLHGMCNLARLRPFIGTTSHRVCFSSHAWKSNPHLSLDEHFHSRSRLAMKYQSRPPGTLNFCVFKCGDTSKSTALQSKSNSSKQRPTYLPVGGNQKVMDFLRHGNA